MSESQEIRVMFVTNSPSGGGAERATNILVNALHERKVVVSLTTINYSEPDSVVPKCEIFEINRTWQGGPVSVLLAYFRFTKVVKSWNPSHLVLECDLPEFFGSLIKGKFRKIVVLQSSKPWITRLKFGELIRRRLRNQNVQWVAVSNHFNVWNFNSAPDAVISNPLILSEIKEDKTIQSDNAIKRICYIGRLSEEKQPKWILDIASQCNLPAEIIGDGLMKNELELKSREIDVDITFHGFVREPWKVLSSGDLLIVPSQYEGDGLVIVEAIARKIPILLNDIPDLRRFKLSNHHYCLNISDFVSRIDQFKGRLNDLIVPEELINEILFDRDPDQIANRWISLLRGKEIL